VDPPNSQGLRLRLPFLTLVTAGCAVAAARLPGWSSWLIYDRSAILSGQIWRMFTGQWVHFSTRHLVYDLIAWCVAGVMIETRGLPCFGWFCALAPWVVSAALLVFEPRMKYCGGLSGLAVAALVYVSLYGLADPPPWSWICTATLAGLAGKLLFEVVAGRSIFDTLEALPVVVSVTSHAAGAATALIFYLLSRASRRAAIP
jgi:rhomboid family GlyGly-CTERM serine protease